MVALGSGALGLATDTIWQYADTMGPWQMSATTVLSIGAMVTWLILDHELWERPKSSAERTRSSVDNIATLMTPIIGVVVLHVALFLSMLFTAGILLAARSHFQLTARDNSNATSWHHGPTTVAPTLRQGFSGAGSPPRRPPREGISS